MSKEIWKSYTLKMEFVSRVMAGVPADPKVIAAWLEARGLTELQEETEKEVSYAGEVEKSRLVFKQNNAGLYIDGYALKAHLKDCSNIVKDFLGVKALRSKVADKVQVIEQYLVFAGRDGTAIQQPDGMWEHPVHVMTMQGPRSALKANDYLEPPCSLSATVRVLNDGMITEEMLRAVFDYGREHGFGAERGLQFGRYTYELVAK